MVFFVLTRPHNANKHNGDNSGRCQRKRSWRPKPWGTESAGTVRKSVCLQKPKRMYFLFRKEQPGSSNIFHSCCVLGFRRALETSKYLFWLCPCSPRARCRREVPMICLLWHVGVDSFPKDQELVSRRQGTLPYTGTIRSFPNLAPCKNQKIPHQGFLLLVKAGIPTISVTLDSHNYNQDFSNLDKERHRPRFRRGGRFVAFPAQFHLLPFFGRFRKG